MQNISSSFSTENSRKVTEQSLTKILVKDCDKEVFINCKEIEWIESSGNYVRFHLQNASYLVRSTLKSLENKLDPLQFVHVHRSTIINISKVKSIEPWVSGDAKIILYNGKTLRMSRNYKKNLAPFRI